MRALETKVKGFEKADADDTQEINALHEMEKAKKEIQDREEKKTLTQGAGGEPEAPRMNVKVWSPHWSLSGLCMLNGTQGSKISKGARKRGQLASLLVEAYQNREALEEKIAEGRRNRKEAGNKYGAVHIFRSALCVPSLTCGKDFNITSTSPVMVMQVVAGLPSFPLYSFAFPPNEAANRWPQPCGGICEADLIFVAHVDAEDFIRPAYHQGGR